MSRCQYCDKYPCLNSMIDNIEECPNYKPKDNDVDICNNLGEWLKDEK